MNIKKISVRFNLDKEADSKAWHYLRSVKGQSYQWEDLTVDVYI